MHRLIRSVLLLGALLGRIAFAQQAPEPLLQLVPNDRPVMLDRYTPAGGPLQRFTSRPGAWYVTLFLAAPTQWPVEFMAMPRSPGHELRVFALDTTPLGEVTSVNLLPMAYSPPRRANAARYIGEFVLPASANLDGVTLVLEQWSKSGEAPSAIWVKARFATGHPSAGNGTAWWNPPPARAASGYSAPALVGPMSPLLDPFSAR